MRQDARRKWGLLALCAVAAGYIVAIAGDNYGFGHTPWYGWWDSFRVQSSQPYDVEFGPPRVGGATARAGIRSGDWADPRQQSFAARVVLFTQPIAVRPTTLLLHRSSQTVVATLVGSAWSDGEPIVKLLGIVPSIIASVGFLVCALLIALRRSSIRDAITLAIVLLCLVPGYFTNLIVVPNPSITLLIFGTSQTCSFLALALLISLSSRFGTRSLWRRIVEIIAYAAIGFDVLRHAAFYFGVLTLKLDPVKYWFGSIGADNTDMIVTLIALLVAVSAVIATPSAERPRSAWLLLPLPTALLLSIGFALFAPSADTWAVAMAFVFASYTFMLIGALAVTYSLLNRRVLDFEFVLSRTLVVGTVSIIVVAAFVLLEWILGAVLEGASHATGLIANGALALALGLSLRYVHKRVDSFVDAVLFRKRRADERALFNFSKEAAYVTERDALLDQAIANIRDHTDARSAALLIESAGAYRARRTFGNGAVEDINENDPAILALKTWHQPLDPQRCSSALDGALALPMLSRGRVFGVLLLGERAGGEAYAPDEVEVLSQVAHGVGTALDALSSNTAESTGGLLASIAVLSETVASLGKKIDMLSVKVTDER